MDSGPRTTVSIPRAVENGASVASATLCGGNHPFVRALALAFSSDGAAGKSCHLICETVAG